MIVKQKLDTIVYNLLIESFYNEEYGPGQKLIPAEIAVKYNISKTPVLQALKRLEREKILDVSSGGKYTLLIPDRKKIDDICEMRYLLECFAVDKVSKIYTEEIHDKLVSMVEFCQRVDVQEGKKQVLKADYNFHRHLIALTENDVLIQQFDMVLNQYILLKYAYGYDNTLQGILEKSYYSHLEITNYLQQGKVKELKKYLKIHIFFEGTTHDMRERA